jgi:hypothetical protein
MAEEAKALRESAKEARAEECKRAAEEAAARRPKKSKKNGFATLKRLYSSPKEERGQLRSLLKVDRQSGGVITALGWVLLRRNLHHQLLLKQYEHD